ncbi:murein hydrolase activator EnvC family protein [Arenibaculum pallidiluteum]|uniref:murein hydrolase activator EnvC family protein n=1 Tax=Arenibaculum pallidiluteum TaxID=2812559 RepID=UPI001A967D1D|nr:peptidoglycan DD-metalloendopeptidase family protein [Arenibaculum pallidiluteum]
MNSGPAAAALAGLALCLPAALAGAAKAADPGDPSAQLQRLERELSAGGRREAELAREAERQNAELGALRSRLIEAAEAARRAETELTSSEEKLRILEGQEREQASRLEADRERIAKLLEALVRVARMPPEALAASPGNPLDTYRGGRLLGAALPDLQAQAEGLRQALDRFAALRRSISERRVQTAQGRDELVRRQTELRQLVAAREAALDRTERERRQAAQRVAALAAEARDLRELMERLEAERRAEAARRAEERRRQAEAEARAAAEARAEATRRAEEERRRGEAAERQRSAARPPTAPSQQGAPLPAAGRVVTRYGEADALGAVSRGLTIETRAGATVTSPFDGSVVFAGPFRGYGLILIVEHANGYHSLIAGLGRIDARVGQQVLAGEPVGAMASAEGSPGLYFELRRNGQPINPQRGIAVSDGKGQG